MKGEENNTKTYNIQGKLIKNLKVETKQYRHK